MRLIDAIRYSYGSSLALVGAGGKTTALFRIASEICESSVGTLPHRTVFVTTTTHLGTWQSSAADHIIQISSAIELNTLEKQIPEGIVLVTGGKSTDRINALPSELLEQFAKLSQNHGIPLLIEADGSNMHALKAPALHEPAIPEFIQNVIVVAGLQGLGKPLSPKWVHRHEEFATLSGLCLNDVVTIDALCNVLLHKHGGLKSIPDGARRIALLNQADTLALQSMGKKISERLISDFDSSIVSSLSPGIEDVTSPSLETSDKQIMIYAVIEPVAGIILAAGGSSRFGKPKQLLPWNDQPMIRFIANTALQAGLSPVIVVIGAAASDVKEAIKDLPLRIVYNQEWMDGLSTSIKAGISSLPENTGSVIFLQADQPQIPPSLIRSLIEKHQISLTAIIAPLIDGQRGNPVLFDRITFPYLNSLEGDIGGRQLFSKFPVHWVDWQDGNLILDIDTPDDYKNLLAIYPQAGEK